MFDLISFDFNRNQLISSVLVLLIFYWLYIFWSNEIIFLDLEKKVFNNKHLEPISDQIDNKYPNTWYPIIQSKDLKPGEVKPIYALEKDLVVYRTLSGKAYILDAHCPHQGSHLGVGGSVVGEDIRCPFHCWTFSGDGACTSVPGLEGSNLPKAKIKTWKSIEMNQFVYLWFHNQELEPQWLPKRYPEFEQANYVGEIGTFAYCHINDIHGNSHDEVHFDILHSMGGIVSEHQLFTKGKVYQFIKRFLRFNWIFVPIEQDHDRKYFDKNRTVILSVTPVLFNISLNFMKIVTTITLCLPMAHTEVRLPWFNVIHYTITAFTPISIKKWRNYQIFYGIKNDFMSKLSAKLMMKYIAINVYPEFNIVNNKVYLKQPHLICLDKRQSQYWHWVQQFYQ